MGARSAVVVQQHTRTLVAVPRPGDVQDVPQDVAGKHLMRAKEADTVKAIDQLLQYKGWLCIPTPAEALHPSGGRIHHRGHADRAYVRAVLKIQIVNDGLGESHWIEAGAGSAQFMFCELKRPKANTSAQRRADQAHWQFEMRARGFVAYRCPDGCDDPLEDFRRFYRETWGEEL